MSSAGIHRSSGNPTRQPQGTEDSPGLRWTVRPAGPDGGQGPGAMTGRPEKLHRCRGAGARGFPRCWRVAAFLQAAPALLGAALGSLGQEGG